jgi:hypothetical protein
LQYPYVRFVIEAFDPIGTLLLHKISEHGVVCFAVHLSPLTHRPFMWARHSALSLAAMAAALLS